MRLLLSILLIVPSYCVDYFNATEKIQIESTTNLPNNQHQTSLSVACGPDAIVVTVPRMAVRSTTSSNYIMFKRDSTTDCQAIEVDADAFQLRINKKLNGGCRSIVKQSSGGRVSYRNEVVYLDVENTKIISLYNFTCLYIGDNNVPLLPSIYKTKLLKGKEMKIRLFRDDSFEESSLLLRDFPTVSVEEFLFVEIYAKNTKHEIPNKHSFLVRYCSASFNTELESAAHYFIYEGCAGFHDSTTEILNASKNSLFRFKFQMFKWVNVTVQSIYIFCNISSCKSSNHSQPEGCRFKECSRNYSNASGQQGVHSDDFSFGESVVLASGPIFPSSSIFLKDRPFKNQNENKNKNNLDMLQEENKVDPNVIHIVIGIMSGICVIIIAFVLYALWRRGVFKKLFRRTTAKPRQEERIQPGFAFILQSSDDKQIFKQAGEESRRKNKTENTSKRHSLTADNAKQASSSTLPTRSVSFQRSSNRPGERKTSRT